MTPPRAPLQDPVLPTTSASGFPDSSSSGRRSTVEILCRVLETSEAVSETRAALALAPGSSRCWSLAAPAAPSASSRDLRTPRSLSQRVRRDAPSLLAAAGVALTGLVDGHPG